MLIMPRRPSAAKLSGSMHWATPTNGYVAAELIGFTAAWAISYVLFIPDTPVSKTVRALGPTNPELRS
jgi:hypothetical protein